MFFSKNTKGFYDPTHSGIDIPADAVEITAEEYAALLLGDAAGQIIIADGGGYPILTDPTAVLPLADLKLAKKAAIEQWRDIERYKDVTAQGRQWQADERSQDLLNKAITLATAGLPLPAAWRDAGNNDMPITALADLLEIAGVIAAQTQTAYTTSWALKAAVDAANAPAAVDAVGWPV